MATFSVNGNPTDCLSRAENLMRTKGFDVAPNRTATAVVFLRGRSKPRPRSLLRELAGVAEYVITSSPPRGAKEIAPGWAYVVATESGEGLTRLEAVASDPVLQRELDALVVDDLGGQPEQQGDAAR